MKYFSEITEKMYDTLEELKKAEESATSSYNKSVDRIKEARETLETAAIPVNKMHNAVNALREEYDAKCDEILDEDVIHEFVDAFQNYEAILSDFVEEYGRVRDDLSDEVKEALEHADEYADIFDEDFSDCDEDCCGNCVKEVRDDCEVAESDTEDELSDEIEFPDLKRIGDGEYFGEGEKDGLKWKMYVKHNSDDKVPSFHDSFSRLLRNIFN